MSISQQNSAILASFKKCLIEFLDDLIETFPDERDFIMLRILVKDQIPTKVIMELFVEDINSIKHKICNRDEAFFTMGNPIFGKLNKQDKFKEIWQSPGMSESNKLEMWKWFDQFLIFANKYLENISLY